MKDLLKVLRDKENRLQQLSREIIALREQARASHRNADGALPLVPAVQDLLADDRGQDIAEYALMLTVILLIVIASVTAIGGNANNMFNAAASQLSAS